MIESFIFGVIQGITEFLPISSSGHLFLAEKIMRFKTSLLPFFVYLHLATVLSIIVFFFRDLKQLLRNRKVLLNLFFSSLATCACAYGINALIGKGMNSKFMVMAGFFTTAFLLLALRGGGDKNISDLSVKSCLIVGILQSLAIIPGLSRSGITIKAALRQGLKREEAFKFSFFIAIPVILGAFIFELKSMSGISFDFSSWAIGFVAAFLLGLLALKIVKKYVNAGRLYRFGYYCAFLGLGVIFL